MPDEAEERKQPDQAGPGVHGNELGLIMRAVKSQFIVLILLEGTLAEE